MRTEKLEIEGMHCGACVKRVTSSLAKVAGVTVKKIELGLAEILIDDGIPEGAVLAAVQSAGYRVTRVRSGMGEEG